ncbi:thermonuclease family protein [Myxococcota bacterium]|nr:thermonuclease family protein [Myxococcota bacterium]
MSLRSAAARYRYYFGKYFVVIASLVLLGFALFFYVGAERFRRDLRAKSPHLFYNDDQVTITDVIDGDEMRIVKKGGQSTMLRLLGIKAFDPTGNVFLFPRYGEMAIQYIQKRFLGLQGRIRLATPKTDTRGRLLATLLFPNKGNKEYTVDVGLELIARGLAITYVKYKFPDRMKYIRAEKQAMEQRLGLWANAEASKMARALQSMWRKETD